MIHLRGLRHQLALELPYQVERLSPRTGFQSAICMMEIASAPPRGLGVRTKRHPPVNSDPDGCSVMTISSLFALAPLAGDAAAAAKKIMRIKQGAEVPRCCHFHRTDPPRIEWSRWSVS